MCIGGGFETSYVEEGIMEFLREDVVIVVVDMLGRLESRTLGGIRKIRCKNKRNSMAMVEVKLRVDYLYVV